MVKILLLVISGIFQSKIALERFQSMGKIKENAIKSLIANKPKQTSLNLILNILQQICYKNNFVHYKIQNVGVN